MHYTKIYIHDCSVTIHNHSTKQIYHDKVYYNANHTAKLVNLRKFGHSDLCYFKQRRQRISKIILKNKIGISNSFLESLTEDCTKLGWQQLPPAYPFTKNKAAFPFFSWAFTRSSRFFVVCTMSLLITHMLQLSR